MEVWTQNSIITPVGRMTVIKALLRGESLTAFETSVVDNSLDEDGVEIVLTMEILTKAMTEVTKTIFGHRALENQRDWMRKYLKKPHGLSTRMTSAALSRLNNCLPLFLGGTDISKFTSAELLEILESSLPYAW